jgi:hypothetical protein
MKSGNKISFNLLLIVILFQFVKLNAQMTPEEAVSKMTYGINVGRSLELDTGEPSRKIQEYYFSDFKNAGFDFVRIPIQWNFHTATSSPYTINAAWLDRVEEVIDWSLKHGLMTVINSHHDKWILENNNFTGNDLARFDSIWAQVSRRFQNKSDSLIFEIANEPNIAISKTDLINQHVIPIIRATNPTRNIVFGSSGTQLSTLKQAKIPVDDYLIASFHTYVPWPFAGEGIGTWGTISEINAVKALMADANLWSETHDIPLLLGEFSARSACEEQSRMLWFYTHINEASKYNISPCVWQDFGWFSIYYPTSSTKWKTTVTDVITHTHHLSAEALTIEVLNVEDAQLNWINRASAYKWIRIERKENSGSYGSLITLDGNATSWLDETSIAGRTYTYRVVCELPSGEITYSFPVIKKIEIVSSDNNSVSDKNGEILIYLEDNHLIINTNDAADSEFDFFIYSLSGQVLISGKSETSSLAVDTSGISSGIFFVNVSIEDGVNITRRVAKLR